MDPQVTEPTATSLISRGRSPELRTAHTQGWTPAGSGPWLPPYCCPGESPEPRSGGPVSTPREPGSLSSLTTAPSILSTNASSTTVLGHRATNHSGAQEGSPVLAWGQASPLEGLHPASTGLRSGHHEKPPRASHLPCPSEHFLAAGLTTVPGPPPATLRDTPRPPAPPAEAPPAPPFSGASTGSGARNLGHRDL